MPKISLPVKFVSDNSFAITGTGGASLVHHFPDGVKILADCALDGKIIGSVSAASHNAQDGDTLVVLDIPEGKLTYRLSGVYRSTDKPETLPVHGHSGPLDGGPLAPDVLDLLESATEAFDGLQGLIDDADERLAILLPATDVATAKAAEATASATEALNNKEAAADAAATAVEESEKAALAASAAIAIAEIGNSKGDLIGFTANDTPVRIPAGEDDQVLTADSTIPEGVAWKTPTAAGAGGFNVVRTAANYTALSLDLIEADVTAGPITITAPASGMFSVVDIVKLAGTNNITISRTAGIKIDGVDENYIIDVDGGDVFFVYDATASNWFVRKESDSLVDIPTASAIETAMRQISDKFVVPSALQGLILQSTQVTNAGFGVWSNGTLESAVSSVNLITNGEFETDTSGWTAGNSATIARITSDKANGSASLQVTNTAALFGFASQAVTTVAGRVYKVVIFAKNGTSTASYVRVGTTSGGYELWYTTSTSNSSSWTMQELTFEAVGTTTYISLTNDNVSGHTALFDSITLYDMGANLVTNGTFNSNTTGWTATNGTLASVAGGINGNCLQVTNGTSVEGYALSTVTGLVVGRLYRISAWLKSGTANAGLAIDGTVLLNPSWGALAGWTPLSAIVEASATSMDVRCWTSNVTTGQTALFDSITLTEVTVGCVDYNTKALDLFTKDSVAQCWRDQATVKEGSFYSLRVYNGAVYWSDGNRAANKEFYFKYSGRSVALGMWVLCNTANKARIGISTSDGTQYSSYHSGSGTWEWLEITSTPTAGITSFNIVLDSGTATAANFSQPQLMFGSSVGTGNFVPISGERILFSSPLISSKFFSETATYSGIVSYEMKILQDSLGRIPKCKGILSRVAANEANGGYGIKIGDQWVYVPSNNAMEVQGVEFAVVDGKYPLTAAAAGTNTLKFWVYYQGVQL